MEFSVNGAKVFAATGGKDFDSQKPTLIFVHGAGCDHTVWQQQSRYFAHRGYSVLAVDLPGHGASAGPPVGSVADLANWIVAAIDAAGAARVGLIGHSLGAQTCLQAAAQIPDRIWGLALLGIAARMPVHPNLLAAANANEPAAIEFIASWGHGAHTHRGGNIAPGIWLIGAGTRLLSQLKDGVLGCDLAAADRYEHALESAGAIECPVLYLLGDEDRMTPPKGAAPLVAGTKRATQIVLPNAGHMMAQEAPDETRIALRTFLRDLT